MVSWDAFDTITVLDFEFHAPSGSRPAPICVVAHEVRSGRTMRRWHDALATPLPFGGPRDLVIAYYASAEIGCYLALGWPTPKNLVDLYTEFRLLSNDGEARGRSILDACAAFGLPTMTTASVSSSRNGRITSRRVSRSR